NELRPLALYWFSQTLGTDRGLESVIAAMGKMHKPVTLTIRGNDLLGSRAKLRSLAAAAGVANAIRFLPLAPPDDMARLAAEHDVGLSTELTTPPNRGICLTNKIFIYLLAGIPALLSNTPAQRDLAPDLGEAARLVDLADVQSIADALDD